MAELDKLSDEDRAMIAAIWIGVDGARSMQAAAERTFAAGKAAGRKEQAEADAKICAHLGHQSVRDGAKGYADPCWDCERAIREAAK